MSETQNTPTAISDTKREQPTNTAGGTTANPHDPIKEIVDHLQHAESDIKELDKSLAQTVESIIRQASDDLRMNQRHFRHEVAYAFQDLERKAGAIAISPQARATVIGLAGSAPGLENARMLNLMHSTATIEDRALVRDIRRAGGEIGQQADQNNPITISRIEVLENRLRLTQRSHEPAPEQPNGDPTQRSATSPADPRESHRSADYAPANGTARRNDGMARTPAQQGPPVVQGFVQPGKLDAVLSLLRGGGPSSGAPSESPPTPFADRLKSFQEARRSRNDEAVLQKAEKAGRTALDALEGFRTGEGATILNRIQSAARSEPGGIAEVLAEMRPGGRFGDLRQQFNSALAKEKGFADAFDQAASALAQYGTSRPGIEQIISRRPDAANLTAKFQQLDAEIGEAAGNVPSRRDSKTMLDDLAQQTAEMIQRAVEALKSLFGRSSPDAGSRTAAGPSMSP